METYKQIADNLRLSGIRGDWCDKIAAADDVLEYAQDCASERDERPACIDRATGGRLLNIADRCPFCGCTEPYIARSDGAWPSCPQCNGV